MQLNPRSKTTYSVRAMVHVARQGGQRLATGREISAEMAVPYKYLTQLLARLVAGGLLTARQGPAGGYALARPPGDITVLDIVEVAEGPREPRECILRNAPCEETDTCIMHNAWRQAEEAAASQLSAKTLADLLLLDR